ncbi:phosphotransferase [Kibdelosporangium aridum]|uniref:phosphotransferase n=1 Tax=Kibdelosporangium aridum TaxID=2030 RepID=UPI0035EDC116
MADTGIEITADLVRDLLQEQHPDLAGLAIREVAGGWGNRMWRLGDELAVRMQRMDPTPELQLKKRRWLPVLAPRLALPVPAPVRFGAPSERFPKHWTVMTWVPGEPLDHTTISRGVHLLEQPGNVTGHSPNACKSPHPQSRPSARRTSGPVSRIAGLRRGQSQSPQCADAFQPHEFGHPVPTVAGYRPGVSSANSAAVPAAPKPTPMPGQRGYARNWPSTTSCAPGCWPRGASLRSGMAAGTKPSNMPSAGLSTSTA